MALNVEFNLLDSMVESVFECQFTLNPDNTFDGLIVESVFQWT